jgi:hypothetical protein
VPVQQGTASLHASPAAGAQVCGGPQVPPVAPGGRLQTVPAQQSRSTVQLAPEGWQAAVHVPAVAPAGIVQILEQHWPPAVQERAFGTQSTHRGPAPASRQSRLQHAASFAQAAPAPAQEVVSRPQAKDVALAGSKRQESGAQQLPSVSPAHAPPLGVQVGPPGFVQWRTCVTGSGTHGAPPQH